MKNSLHHFWIGRLLFTLGVSFTILGSILCLSILKGVPKLVVLPAAFFLIIGALFAYTAVQVSRKSGYLYFSAFCFQVGIIVLGLALQIIPIPFYRLWPLLSIIAGLSFIPVIRFNKRKPVAVFLVPAIAFVGIGVVLLIFSFHVVDFSFRRFLITWWPLFLLIGGLMLFLISLLPSEPKEVHKKQRIKRPHKRPLSKGGTE
ncbi:MAG TPA: DUF5668 domain-containing protein [Termitinemataceae bacterium]|nr:DUF5668 domain-containing protein [Termitinemataceae bacterium]HOM24092.1 DUF5668 domain-containing protein [Termitinemataceae bacterium]HPQ00027.1 DUF5668 domain-containing protein [Termitinemataceae bacterium]